MNPKSPNSNPKSLIVNRREAPPPSPTNSSLPPLPAADGRSTYPTAPEPRSAEFHPTVWGDFFITLVFHSEESVSGWNQQIESLKEEVMVMLSATDAKLSQKLNLIDTIERLWSKKKKK
ncbi:unnamed protein product [Linum trigynum]|uniref:Uncharacterized protein n=1 Tax=Linum trigynum TaxID=586398 RepID=A0AAV2E2J2_9ROSI